jgi:DNA (cytosine-5)-methyltransferase 1
MSVFYNDFDPGCCAWLRELTEQGLIPKGVIDGRSIADIQGDELRGHTRCHFFAGIAGWELALQLAGWPDDAPVWTGSCPCPPFSAAGKKKACPQCQGRDVVPHPLRTGIFVCCVCGHEWLADGRHLWPEFLRLIAECRPPVVCGEQVAGQDGLIWLAGVRATLEALGYAFWAADLCAAGVNSPHIRQRLWWGAWLADSALPKRARQRLQPQHIPGQAVGGLADAERPQWRQEQQHQQLSGGRQQEANGSRCGGNAVWLGDTGSTRLERWPGERCDDGTQLATAERTSNPWARYALTPCRDGKTRRIPAGAESVLLGLADGLSAGMDDGRRAGFPLCQPFKGRNGLLKGYGNAINPYTAAEFVKAFMEAICLKN